MPKQSAQEVAVSQRALIDARSIVVVTDRRITGERRKSWDEKQSRVAKQRRVKLRSQTRWWVSQPIVKLKRGYNLQCGQDWKWCYHGADLPPSIVRLVVWMPWRRYVTYLLSTTDSRSLTLFLVLSLVSELMLLFVRAGLISRVNLVSNVLMPPLREAWAVASAQSLHFKLFIQENFVMSNFVNIMTNWNSVSQSNLLLFPWWCFR